MKEEFTIKNTILTKYNGNGGDVVIPNGVTRISDYAFYECKNLTSVVMPENIISIGRYAFHGCESLISVEIPNSVKSISNNAFYNCYSLTNITIPDSVKTIGRRAFYNCYSLINITIPNSVMYIGEDVFERCKKPSKKEYDKLSISIEKCSCLEEKRNHLAEKKQVINTSVIIRDFLQKNKIKAKDIYRFLCKKEFSIIDLEKAKNQFIDYAIYGKETELVKEFFNNLEAK